MNYTSDIQLPLISPNNSPQKGSFSSTLTSDECIHTQPHASYFTEYLDESADPNKYAPRPSFFRWLTFTNLLPYIKSINRMHHPPQLADIPNPDKSSNIESKLLELIQSWNDELKKKEPVFYKALCRAFKKEISQALILSFIDTTMKVLFSIQLGRIINIMTKQNLGEGTNKNDLISSAVVLSGLILFSLFLKNWAFFTVVANVGRVRLAISGLLYKKLHSTSLTSLHEIKLGKVINLLGNDLNDIQGLNNVLAMIINPYMMLLGTYMVWEYFEFYCLIGLCSMIFATWCQIQLSNKTEVPRKQNKKTIDERVKSTHDLIEGIRLIKMYAWEKVFGKKIVELRETEHMTFLRMNHIDALGRTLSGLSVYLNILLICVFYTICGETLTTEKVYASMMTLTYLSASLVFSHQGRMGLVNIKMVTQRVQEVLMVQDVQIPVRSSVDEERTISEESRTKPITFSNFSGFWTASSLKPCLWNINMVLKPGSITAIIGKIGSGKSSLLLSFLNELPKTTGTLDYSGRLAYVEQDPIIFAGTVRENILFGREYNEGLYRQVLEDCRLEADLASFVDGDLILIGERGVTLSGGQKVRVSLARALYAQSDIYLLDDPFSALDSRISREIFDKVFRSTAARKRTIILVTHHLHFAKEADNVVLMSEGRIEAQGQFLELEKLNIGLLNVFKASEDKEGEAHTEILTKTKKNEEVVLNSDKKDKGPKEDATQVSWQTYREYLAVKGSRNLLIKLISLLVLSNLAIICFGRILGYWAENSEFAAFGVAGPINNISYITICSLLLVVIFVLSYIKSTAINSFLLSTNTELHKRMLDTIMRACVSFFDTNPIGRILNRFSGDLGVLDKNNTKMALELMDCFVSQISLLFTICFVNPAIIIPGSLVVYGLVRTGRQFSKPMKLTKKLDLASKSPMISAVPATLQGLVIIRVYNQGGRFIREFMDMAYNSIKTYSFLTRSNSLFGFMLDTPVQLLTITGIWTFVILAQYYNMDPALVGLCLMYLFKLGSQSTQIIGQSVQISNNMQSAQRILDYCAIQSEALNEIPEVDTVVMRETEEKWPKNGNIELNNIFLRYRKELGFVLNGISLTIPAGTKVACVGRTGAGKSSLIQTLFRMVEYERGLGSFIKIDGVDISSLGLTLLRSKMTIIPQVPVIFSGTIKKNLDPLEKLSDEKLWRVLEEVDLKVYVQSLKDQLNTDLTMSTSVFSAGQKQMVCLARAIVNESKIIILDEATASVDLETDKFIQKTIMEKFKDCTVLTIAHRLITIANYDKIVVLDKGFIVEYDTPYKLLVQEVGDKEIKNREGVFAEMVKSTGAGMASRILEIAREQHDRS